MILNLLLKIKLENNMNYLNIFNNIVKNTFLTLLNEKSLRAFISLLFVVLCFSYYLKGINNISSFFALLSILMVTNPYSMREHMKWKMWLSINYLKVAELILFSILLLTNGCFSACIVIMVYAIFEGYITFFHDVYGSPYDNPFKVNLKDFKNTIQKQMKEMEVENEKTY